MPGIAELTIDSLAAGGDAVGRDANGRVTFVPRAAPGDRVRVRIVHATASFARGELIEVLAPGPARVEPACPAFARGCGGCAWQHVARADQLAAKQAIVDRGLRKLAGLRVHAIEDPCAPLGWRRRARFHVRAGTVGLFAHASHDLVELDGCPQLEPALDAAVREIVDTSRRHSAPPPDGELYLLAGHRGDVAVATERPWPAGAARDVAIEVDPGVHATARQFAQASAAGNRALVARAAAALGAPPHAGAALLELHAGTGNLTRAYRAAGWRVVATDLAPGAEIGVIVADAAAALASQPGPFTAIALDPPRAGAADAVAGILRHAPSTVVYVSCDVATLARDAAALVATGAYRATDAYPIDLMPQTAHVEVVLRLERVTASSGL
nr:TRAM domain-containing protein [Kofleriaceae bacterium]